MTSPRLYCALLPLLLALPVRAAVFLVDTSSDDGSAAFQVCDADPGNGNCSLRGAITVLNTQGGPHVVTFNLPTSDPGYIAATDHWRITTASDLPTISRNLEINGYSQPGAVANVQTPEQGGSTAVLKIELRSGTPGQGNGLFVANDNAGLHVQGLAINSYQRNLFLFSPGSHRVEGCFVGTDITGMQLPPGTASTSGITLSGTVVVGGTTPAARNVIAGHRTYAIQDFNLPVQATIQGNLIGVDAAGTGTFSQDVGLFLTARSQGSVIGGANGNARNIISGFRQQAVYIFGSGSLTAQPPVRVQGNYFGTDVSGTQRIGNGLASNFGFGEAQVYVFGLGHCGAVVGGDNAGEGNLIAHGHGPGVAVAGCRDAAVIGNRFARNARLPVDLGLSFYDGLTANDPGDADGAPGAQAGNRLQNRPELLSLLPTNGGADLALTYRVDTAPEHATWPLQVRIERGDGGQPTALIAQDSYPVTAAQQAQTVVFPASELAGSALVLSVTDNAGNTSEFESDALLFSDFE